MRTHLLALTAFALPSAAFGQAGEPLFEIPRQFWGEYNQRLEDCGTALNDTRLRISWEALQFYESTAVPQGIIRLTDGSVMLLVESEGEGERWTDMFQLTLSADGRSLTITHPQTDAMAQDSFTRQRCP